MTPSDAVDRTIAALSGRSGNRRAIPPGKVWVVDEFAGKTGDLAEYHAIRASVESIVNNPALPLRVQWAALQGIIKGVK